MNPRSTPHPPPGERLFGAWRLVEFCRLVDGEVVSHPLGADAVGLLSYQSDGQMSAMMMQRHRPWVGVTSWADADAEQRGVAGLFFVAYGGRFTVEGDVVIHDVDIALNPEFLGTRQVREVDRASGHLVLLTEERPTRSGRVMRDRLTWQRMREGESLCT